jgi:DNA-binding beta-propeller fold protein YncE
VASDDGETVWVAARESNSVLAFSARALSRDPGHARVADVLVGQAPVGLAVIDGGRRVIVANSDRFAQSGASASLSLVDAAAALSGRPAVLGTIATGSFPRAVTPLRAAGKVLLVANFNAKEVEVVDLRAIP